MSEVDDVLWAEVKALLEAIYAKGEPRNSLYGECVWCKNAFLPHAKGCPWPRLEDFFRRIQAPPKETHG